MLNWPKINAKLVRNCFENQKNYMSISHCAHGLNVKWDYNVHPGGHQSAY